MILSDTADPDSLLLQAAFAPSHVPSSTPADASARPQIMDAVRAQIDYYFSIENLVRDIFLRSKVSSPLSSCPFILLLEHRKSLVDILWLTGPLA